MANNTIVTYTDYWREIVLKDYDEFAAHQGSLRLAFHLAVTLTHMADWVFFGEQQSVRQNFAVGGRSVANEAEFGTALCAIDSNYAVVRAIANSAKHYRLRQSTIQGLKAYDQDAPSSTANTFSQAMSSWGNSWGQSWGLSWSRTRVQIEGTAGADRYFMDVAKATRSAWESLAAQHGWTL